MRPRRSRAAQDDGFTLVELLVAIAIMGVITLPLANLLLSFFLNNSTTTGRLAESHDQQLAATYFAQDVADIGTRDQTSLAFNRSVWPGSFPAGSCGSSSAAGDQILLLKWDDLTWDGTTQNVVGRSVAYVRGTSGGETQLRRLFCTGTTQQSSIVVVHNLDPGVAPAVVCSPSCTAGAPATVTLTLGIRSNTGSGAALTVSLTGDRRQS
ncbi:MAG TPA: prepilin-type N-terminal cleavage/methylation domain-containing protein [Jatrophihabitans sp.]|jgi:prepilin-type N-terminal cleavage/methylation domain-containing protein|nr:prepilin-type N-terminal cleavage/methylation domain-containing protein [Jatrophihabitans sp.]